MHRGSWRRPLPSADLQEQHAQLSAARRAMPQYEADMTTGTAESFTGGVAATVRGGKKYVETKWLGK